MNARLFVCVFLCGYWVLGVGCRWDLPLSVIEKCDLENVCPTEHESYLHGDGGELRGGSPDPRQEEPVIGRVLTLRATLSPRRMQNNALFNSAILYWWDRKNPQETVIQNPCKSDNQGHQLEFQASAIQGAVLREGLGQSAVFACLIFCAGQNFVQRMVSEGLDRF